MMSLHFKIALLGLLCGSAGAFAPAAPVLLSALRGTGMHRSLVMTNSHSESGSDDLSACDSARRRMISGSAAALLTVGMLPAPSNALFGIGEPFSVFEDEDRAEEGSGFPLYGKRDIMKKKKHGTSDQPVMKNLRWGCDNELADKICNFNRHFAENAGYFTKTSWLKEIDQTVETTYYDSVTGKPLFIAPRGRSFADFVKESRVHGWPSFRDEEVVWDNVRCLRDGETVSLSGTHLGHNLPDRTGNRYCINLVSIAGNPSPS
eukprot:CAMPEP_0181290086 /NCGR_PEP_ID=MMETSP1101-20121128/1230_1 /TAXON_ID=46948 /ORGANISM="Rhodomonas abbreviata, Strain Caron Lab Isolate" /LENGTH=261 /DNA_ID=CAMNT_0023394355 /DNA_START=57 /DNA_END=842 /DNA_ORIENTATION=-